LKSRIILVEQKVVTAAGDILDAEVVGEWATNGNNPESP
jgi:hypothetical protein